MIAVLTPTTRPRESTSGPPEPGPSGAVCWITSPMRRSGSGGLSGELTTPAETVD
jgi:hypothetical protein